MSSSLPPYMAVALLTEILAEQRIRQCLAVEAEVIEKCKALEARLDAAEKVCELVKDYKPNYTSFRMDFFADYKAWQKVRDEQC